jgi:hypothetical protein
MSLDTIIKEIKSLQPFADENPDSGPVETMSGRRGRRIQAINRIADLRQAYSEELLRTAIFIVNPGAKREEFESIAVNKFDLFHADPETFYNDLAKRVHPTLYLGNASTSNLFDVLGRHLEDKMQEIGITGYNQLIFREKYMGPVKGPEDFAKILKIAINEQIGPEIVGAQAAASIVDKAIASGHVAKTTPIVLTTSDEKLALELMQTTTKTLSKLMPRTFIVNAGKTTKELRAIEDSINLKEVTEDSVKATLDQIKSLIKK